jgi:hypothetical protein
MDKKYLIHFNDGMMRTTSDIQDSVFQAADEGELDIIDITDPMIPAFYSNGIWRDIELAGKSEIQSSTQSHLNN